MNRLFLSSAPFGLPENQKELDAAYETIEGLKKEKKGWIQLRRIVDRLIKCYPLFENALYRIERQNPSLVTTLRELVGEDEEDEFDGENNGVFDDMYEDESEVSIEDSFEALFDSVIPLRPDSSHVQERSSSFRRFLEDMDEEEPGDSFESFEDFVIPLRPDEESNNHFRSLRQDSDFPSSREFLFRSSDLNQEIEEHEFMNESNSLPSIPTDRPIRVIYDFMDSHDSRHGAENDLFTNDVTNSEEDIDVLTYVVHLLDHYRIPEHKRHFFDGLIMDGRRIDEEEKKRLKELIETVFEIDG
ncbi:hypothetical protein L596_013350 [Steinernema carpocapsae]|uniref:Uncharacterized protein n=1 Tax=Steinernema carpocapsae TaxID=34508 RepID=A0A4U5P0R1_STECR|nr:hypothetical protein L596_013350 [Steinernema carpocapsae]